MSKEEFISILRQSLYTEISSIEIENNIRYYNDYIDEQLRSGKSLNQIMTELGDPRLIARTIVETSKVGKTMNSSSSSTMYQDDYNDTSQNYNHGEDSYSKTYSFNGKVPLRYRVLGIAALVLIVTLLVFLGSLAIGLFFRIGIPILLIILVVQLIRKR